MKTEIQYLHFTPDEFLKDFVSKKMNKLLSNYDWITDGKIFIKIDKNNKQKDKLVEIHLNVPGDTVYSEARSDFFTLACDEAIHAARQQLRKQKERLNQHSLWETII